MYKKIKNDTSSKISTIDDICYIAIRRKSFTSENSFIQKLTLFLGGSGLVYTIKIYIGNV